MEDEVEWIVGSDGEDDMIDTVLCEDAVNKSELR